MLECGKLHHLNLSKFNTTGSGYANNDCTLKCVIDGTEASVNAINEGATCPTNSKGVSDSVDIFFDKDKKRAFDNYLNNFRFVKKAFVLWDQQQ